MAHSPTAEQILQQSRLGDDARSWSGRLFALGVALLAGAGLWAWCGSEASRGQFLFSYLVAYCFFLSISLGATFFVAIDHLVGATWSIVVRRISELLVTNLPLMALLSLPLLVPVLLGDHTLWHWTDPHAAGDPILSQKTAWLNVPFFLARCVIYFAVWFVISRFFFKNSVAQDATGDPLLTRRMRSRAAPIIIVMAVTTTFFAFDFLMALEPHWFSTIFGVYFFAGCVLSFFATTAIVALLLQENRRLSDMVTTEHYHDLGKYMFAFVVFWGYIAFSQFMLIWYADIPEETYWYDARQQGSWIAVSYFLLFGHLLIPLAGLLSRVVKRNRTTLALWAAILLFMHWVDLYWIAMPTFHTEGMRFSGLDVLCLGGVGCVYAAAWLRRAGGVALAPVKDPFLVQSLRHKNLF